MEWIHEQFDTAKTVRNHPVFIVNSGTEICKKCFCLLFRLSEAFYYNQRKKHRLGSRAAGYLYGRSPHLHTEEAIAWLANYIELRGDYRPDKKEVLLPYGTRKINVYAQYIEEVIEQMKMPISRSSFYKMWTENFPHVKIKPVRMITYLY